VQHKVPGLHVCDLPEPMSDRLVRPARHEHPQSKLVQRPSLGQQLHDSPDVVVVVALVECINNQKERGWVVMITELQQWTKDEVMPLVAQGLAGNVATLCDGLADVLPRRWDAMRKLHCNARDKLACVTDVVATSREEEAGRETFLVVVRTSYGPRDRRFARPRQSAQPEDVSLVLPLRPLVYLVEEVDARVWEAGGLVLLRKRVEGRVGGVR
jgi:hypothetical protein